MGWLGLSMSQSASMSSALGRVLSLLLGAGDRSGLAGLDRASCISICCWTEGGLCHAALPSCTSVALPPETVSPPSSATSGVAGTEPAGSLAGVAAAWREALSAIANSADDLSGLVGGGGLGVLGVVAVLPPLCGDEGPA